MAETPYFVSYPEALRILKLHPLTLSTEFKTLDEAFHRILSSDLESKVDDPRFDNSAMDGFAFRYEDSTSPPRELKIIQTIQAGSNALATPLASGQAARIMTGAPIPEGADAILPIEKCDVDQEKSTVSLLEEGKKHFIRKQGENLSKGQVSLKKGALLTPSSIGLCATMGYPEVPVYTQAKIGILSTGDELKFPGEELRENEIYESNSFGLSSLVQQHGHHSKRYDSVIDSIDELREKLNTAAQECDLILTSGGVSMGEWDLVRKLMEEEGDIKFWRVKIRPGSPPLFGYWKGTPLFGLPGNPASSHVVFRMLVAPYLRHSTSGGGIQERKIRVQLAQSLKADEHFLILRRIKIDMSGDQILAYSTGYQGSGNLNSLVLADGLTLLEPGHTGEKGTWCEALLL
ncbi:MAG: molybdopterin molybdenumtransferase MoeA [Euryarchaeota archaeon TMED99]|nr:MAG: molybdopterin molybdenumtransferase MoeA [Euryarchaeota archaeon TMED99]